MAATNNKCRIKRGDQVVVVAGKDKGQTGRVLRVLPAKRQVIVEGVRRVRRHQRPVGDQPGGILDKEMPIDISNVALWDATEGRKVKVGYRTLDDGRKVRVDRSTGAVLDND
jgi:large subunit ribosomal protein L24